MDRPNSPDWKRHVGEEMSSFDPMAAAIDWLDAYRAASLSIVDCYAPDAALECCCGGHEQVRGKAAITDYWRQRFLERPAGELTDLTLQANDVVVSYRVPDGIVRAILQFDDDGKIRRCQCGPNR